MLKINKNITYMSTGDKIKNLLISVINPPPVILIVH